MTEPGGTPGSRGIPVGRYFGVQLVVTPGWILVAVLGVLLLPPELRNRTPGTGVAASYVVSLALVLLLYASILAHEASHVAVAKALGMRVGRVVLRFYGAVSEILQEPADAAQEFLTAAAGPLTSVLVAGVAAAVGSAFPDDSTGALLGWGTAYVNGLVAAFNLLPGLPLDGGHLLRAVIWRLSGNRTRALLAAGWVGRGLAAAVLVTGSYAPASVIGDRTVGSLYLFFLAAFLYTNATVAITRARVEAVLPHVDLGAMLRPALTVDPQLPLAEAVRRAREVGARALVVVDSRDRWSGIVSEAAVQATPVERQPWLPVSDVARPMEDGMVLEPDLDGQALMAAVQRKPASEYLVAGADGRLRGVLARVDLVAALRAAGLR